VNIRAQRRESVKRYVGKCFGKFSRQEGAGPVQQTMSWARSWTLLSARRVNLANFKRTKCEGEQEADESRLDRD
jgi:hypothetical protein